MAVIGRITNTRTTTEGIQNQNEQGYKLNDKQRERIRKRSLGSKTTIT